MKMIVLTYIYINVRLYDISMYVNLSNKYNSGNNNVCMYREK